MVHISHRGKGTNRHTIMEKSYEKQRVEDCEADGIRTLNWKCLFLIYFSDTFPCSSYKKGKVVPVLN
jgi:hypothetical protein